MSGGGGGNLSVLLVVTTVSEDTYKAFASWSMYCQYVLYDFIAPFADTISQQ